MAPADALYELGKKQVRDRLRAIREGRIPSELSPVEYEGKYYGIEMDAVPVEAFLPTIVDKLEDAIEDVFEKWREKIEDRVEKEIRPKVDRKVGQILAVLEEIKTRRK